MAVDRDKRGVRGDEGRLRLGDECGIAGEIDEIAFYFFRGTRWSGRGWRAFGIAQSRRNGNLARDFFFVSLRGAAAFRNYSPPRRRARAVRHPRDQFRLAVAAVA